MIMSVQLHAENLKKRYRSYVAVKNLSLQLGPEIVGLLGPNGAGKTKSFNMLAGLECPDEGSIYLNGNNITRYPLHKRATLGIRYLPQDTSIFQKLSVSDNLLAVLELKTRLNKRQRYKQCNELLEEFKVGHLRNTMGYQLSGGERRRVEIARALVLTPTFILLDEPFAGIDPISIANIKEHIVQLYQRGIGVLITDHNVRETLMICQRAYIMHAGIIMAHGTPSEILSNAAVKDFYLGKAFEPIVNRWDKTAIQT